MVQLAVDKATSGLCDAKIIRTWVGMILDTDDTLSGL